MPLKLFELVGTDEARPFSPFCWRTRMALAHKGLIAESIPWCFTEKQAIAPHKSEKVPVLLDGETSVADSWVIEPMRLTLKTQAYLGGEKPNYFDYIVFGGFQWARVVSPFFKLLAEGDPIYAWRERLLDAFDGMARRSPGYPV
jgi:glutathione S-transferase